MRRRTLARSTFAATIVLVVIGLGLTAVAPTDLVFNAMVAAIAMLYVGAGALLASRLPRNAIGWILIVIGAFQAINLIGSSYGGLSVSRGGNHLPFTDIVFWVASPTWIPSVGCLVTFLLLLFPDGRPPSPRWRIVAWVAGVGIATAVVGAWIGYWPVRHRWPTDPDPVGVGSVVLSVGFIVTGMAAIASIAALVVRFRRASGDERQQLRWFLLAGAIVVGGLFLNFTPVDAVGLFISGFLVVPITVAVAILKYRLYDLEVVINRTVAYGVLAGFVTLVYVGMVVGVGAILGRAGNAVLSAVAAAVVALVFQPVRRWAQHLANRLVYGKRATPYQVLSDFSERMGGAFAIDDLLPRMARILAEGTGSQHADVWLRIGDELHVDASWPSGGPVQAPVPVTEVPPELVAVMHQGELLGALSVTEKPGVAMSPTERKLIDDLAAQAGLVLRNVALTEELKARLEELRESRRRIVAAQDEERRRIARNIHDGAQQQLVALGVKAGLLGRLASGDPKVEQLAAQLRGDAQVALDDLRVLARGIYPPLLADQGLAAALEAQARRSPVPVIDPDGSGRYGPEVEAAVYFCSLEALQNLAKHSDATAATVRLATQDGDLIFEVTDDGSGFDVDSGVLGTGLRGMADRLAALDGSLEIRSAPGDGTTVTGRVPAQEVPA